MSVNYEKTGPTTGELHFTIDKDVVNKGLDNTFKSVRKTLNVPGFRKGKVPRKIFNSMYGEEALYEDTLNNILPAAYAKAIDEAGIEPVDQPSIDLEESNKDEDWKIKATVVLAPEVKLGEYTNLDVHKQDRNVSDEEVDKSLDETREEFAELVVVESEAEEGNTVVIDFLGKKDGEAFEGGDGKNYSLELGSNSFIPGFEEQLVGAKSGEELEVNVTFPEDYPEESLAGEEAIFEVTVHEIKERRLPELDDEFAQDVDDDVDTMDELREKRKAELVETKEAAANEAVEEEAINKAVENAEIVEIPYGMTHQEVHRQMDIFLNNLQSQGISPETYYQITGTTEADLHQQMEIGAEDRVKTNLVLEAIVEAEKLEATEEEKEAEINNLSDEYGLDEEQVREALTDDMLVHDIAIKKAIKLVTDSVNEVLEDEEAESSEEA